MTTPLDAAPSITADLVAAPPGFRLLKAGVFRRRQPQVTVAVPQTCPQVVVAKEHR